MTAVEFGLIAPAFLGLLCATFELGYVHFQNEMLEYAVTNAGRAMLTGRLQISGVSTTDQFVSKYLCQTSGQRTLATNFDCTKLIVDVRPAAAFTTTSASKSFYQATDNRFCPGQPGQIMVVRVAYPLKAIMPLNIFNRTAGVVGDVPGQSGYYHILLGSALFKSENWAGTYTTPAGCS